jgi:hypothetical protein
MGPSGGQPARTWQVTISSLFLGSRDRLPELAEAPVESPLGKPPFDHKSRRPSVSHVRPWAGLLGGPSHPSMTRGRVLRLKELHLARAVQSFTGEAQVPAVRIRGTSAPRRPLVCDRQSRADGRRTSPGRRRRPACFGAGGPRDHNPGSAPVSRARTSDLTGATHRRLDHREDR